MSLGITATTLRSHLERQFRRGMTWENYGVFWHVDHIRPLASFDLTDAGQMRAAWCLSNLRPLEAHRNIAKGARLDFLL